MQCLDLSATAFSLMCDVFWEISSSKKTGKGKRPGKGGNRYFKSIGLGFKTPREAIEGNWLLTVYFVNCIFFLFIV